MSETFDRRTLLRVAAALTAATGDNMLALGAAPALRLGRAAPFSFDRLKESARQLAGQPYTPPPQPAPEIVSALDYDAWGKISFKTDRALFADGPGRFPVTFFHLGMFFRKSVSMNVVTDGKAREILYESSDFDMPPNSVARKLPEGAGFAGLRIQEQRDGKLDWRKNDWVAFLGAAYFRAVGELGQYGLSARGLALDSAVAGKPEEFPDFTHLYIEAMPGTDQITIYALLNGPSVAGAYRFVMTRTAGVVMDVDLTLYLRKVVTRFGLAPLTSMYWFSETAKPTAIDWRPEVHDSDGLAMWTGWGARLWRPLNDPPHSMASAFTDENPKGFGLLQRDRVFDHYLDGVNYDRRPSLWVEPKGNWGKGSVQLIELPTDDEIHDNIVAMWVPAEPPTPGTAFDLAYRLTWLADEPHPTDLARVVATRLGRGGQPGQPRPPGVRKFLVEFLGGPLGSLAFGAKPEMVLETSRGRFTDYRMVEAVPDGIAGHWRVQFDLADVTGTEPVELKLHLTVDGKPASETWLFQYHPF
jgi:glucans biosynthesis protein